MTPPSLQHLAFLTDKLKHIHQEHLLEYWSQLSTPQQVLLLQQIAALDVDLFYIQRQLLEKPNPTMASFIPLSASHFSGEDADWKHQGMLLLEKKKVACVVLAGGQGSRLNYSGPKGCFPISKIKKKSLFQLLAEKVLAASKLAKQDLPLAIMTSPLNHEATRAFFSKHHYFQLNPKQVDFFCQPMWPFLSSSGDLFLEDDFHIALGPNGNGCLAKCLLASGLWHKWKNAGVDIVSIIPIDNPLALPFDIELCGFHHEGQQDVTIKATTRQSSTEDVGVLVRHPRTHRTSIIEYSALSAEERTAVNAQGSLKYGIANIGLYCVSMPFLYHAAEQPLPIHHVLKQAQRIGCSQKEFAWKFEEFIFDLFQYCGRCETLVYPREECFAPLKSLSGSCSPEAVQQALSKHEQHIFHQITGKYIDPNTLFELEADFYYPSSTVQSSFWEHKAFFEEPFVEAS